MSVLLKVHGVDAGYKDLSVLFDVSLEVHEGESVVVLGSNGAGKSTLLRTVSGIVHATKGEIQVFGKRVDALRPEIIARMGVAHVPEGRGIFGKLTVDENLDLGGYFVHKTVREDHRDRVFGLFPRLADRRSKLARTLSGGEQQMLAIGRALMSGPRLVMLDEPTLGLAPIVVQTIFDVIREIQREGVTVLLVEQHVLEALSIANRAYVLQGGRVGLSGTSDELLNNGDLQRAYMGM